MNEVTKSSFLETYNKAFDDNNMVRPCSRVVTIKLIELANELELNVNHGNIKTGFMDLDSMRSLRARLV